MAEIKWSNSSLSLLQGCGEAFRRRYLEREYTPANPRMIRGTVVHKVASRAYHRKLTEQTLPSLEEAQDLAATAPVRHYQSALVSNIDLAGVLWP